MNEKSKYYIEKLQLKPHPEGGYYCETYRSEEKLSPSALPDRYEGERCWSTAIYFLIDGGQKSTFHKLKSDEIWHYYDGSSVRVYLIDEKGKLQVKFLGQNIDEGENFQVVIRSGLWFAAEVIDKDSFSLYGCTVSPGFEFQDFQLGKRSQLTKEFPHLTELIIRFTNPGE